MACGDKTCSQSSVFTEVSTNYITKFQLKPMQNFENIFQDLKNLQNSTKKELLIDLSLLSDDIDDGKFVEALMPLLLDPKVKTVFIPRQMIERISGRSKGYLLDHLKQKFGSVISIFGCDLKMNSVINADIIAQKLSVAGRTPEKDEDVKVVYKVLNNIEEYVPLYVRLIKLCHRAAQYGNLRSNKRKWNSPHTSKKTHEKEEEDDSSSDTDSEEDIRHSNLNKKKKCYICKNQYFLGECQEDQKEMQRIYYRLCPSCARENYLKRNQKVDMAGRVAIVTGGRIKIGFETALKLLRDGAKVIVTTRFPRDALERYSKKPDFEEFSSRLKIYPLDMKNIRDIYRFVNFVKVTESHLDVLINNAAQTLYRPINFYQHLLEAETELIPEGLTNILVDRSEVLKVTTESSGENESKGNKCSSADQDHNHQANDLEFDEFEGPPQKKIKLDNLMSTYPQKQDLMGPSTSSEVVQTGQSSTREYSLHGLKDYPFPVSTLFPRGQYDEDGQQLDLRKNNSWRSTLENVPLPELLEVLMINTIAPFILNKELKPMLMKSPHQKKFIVNVSAMEGQFTRRNKTMYHPHTNMAKAALNMMTRTAALGYQNEGIYMTSVDTGWVSDERPHHMAKHEEKKGFILPLDSVDGAARVYDPIVHGLSKDQKPHFAVFLKNYKPYPW